MVDSAKLVLPNLAHNVVDEAMNGATEATPDALHVKLLGACRQKGDSATVTGRIVAHISEWIQEQESMLRSRMQRPKSLSRSKRMEKATGIAGTSAAAVRDNDMDNEVNNTETSEEDAFSGESSDDNNDGEEPEEENEKGSEDERLSDNSEEPGEPAVLPSLSVIRTAFHNRDRFPKPWNQMKLWMRSCRKRFDETTLKIVPVGQTTRQQQIKEKIKTAREARKLADKSLRIESRERAEAAAEEALDAAASGAGLLRDVSRGKRKQRAPIDVVPTGEVAPKKQRLSRDDMENESMQGRLLSIEKRSRVKVTDTRTFKYLNGEKIFAVQSLFNVDVMLMQEPPDYLKLREVHRGFVDDLKLQIKLRPTAIVAPLALIVKGIKRLEDFDVSKLNEYQFVTAGGNHSRVAFRELVEAMSTDERVIFGADFQFRPAALYLDNLSNEDFLAIAEGHNADNEFRSKQNFMDRIRYCHNCLYNDVGEFRFSTDKDWKLYCLKGLAKRQSELNAMNPIFMVAKWPEELQDILRQISDLCQARQLKDSKPLSKSAAKKSSREGPSSQNVPQVKGSTITGLCGLSEGMIKFHLLQVRDRKWTFTEMHKNAMDEKTHDKIRSAWKKELNLHTDEQLIAMMGEPVLKVSYNTFGGHFKKNDSAPPAMKRYIAQERARVESLRRAAETTTVQLATENMLRFTPTCILDGL
jgi:hypothetical protein